MSPWPIGELTGRILVHSLFTSDESDCDVEFCERSG